MKHHHIDMKHLTIKPTFFITALFLSVSILLISLVLSFSTYAQNQNPSQSLEVSPPSQEIEADPGKIVSIKAKVRNKSRETLPVTVRVEDFTAQGEEGQVALIDGGTYSLSNWTTVTPSEFTLEPGEEQEVEGIINIPSHKVAGGYYGSFVFSVMGEKIPNAATVGQEIASLFLLRVSGPVQEKIYLDELTAPAFSEFGPIPLSLKFTNSGNIHTKVFGLVNITDMFGQKVADLVISGTNIFPGASRIVKTSLNQQFLIGKYTATAIIYYGSIKNETLTAVTSFTVIPLRIIAVILIIAILLFLMRKRLKKAMKALFG